MAWWAAHQDGDAGERPWLPSALRVSCDSHEWQVRLRCALHTLRKIAKSSCRFHTPVPNFHFHHVSEQYQCR